MGRWKASLIHLFILFFTQPLLPPSLSFLKLFSHCRQTVVSLPYASLFFLLFLYYSVFFTIYPPSIQRQKIKWEPESIWTCCGMPFGTLNASQPWATICAILCHRGTAVGHCQWHTTIHLPIHPCIHLKRKWWDSLREKRALKGLFQLTDSPLLLHKASKLCNLGHLVQSSIFCVWVVPALQAG